VAKQKILMEQIIQAAPPGHLENESLEKKPEKEFTPTGAIAFFILLVLLGLFIWFSIYFLMLSRT
jgi:hypothetical protein